MERDHIRVEIEWMRVQIRRQRKDIKQLAKAGVSTMSAEARLVRMQDKVDALCADRERLAGEERLKRPTYASCPTARR